ncbi:MAG: alanine--tRNA ligase [Firmicutes bacterium]|nr:alanine--tRNA ligase [Bacillota bacterium]
MKKLNYKELKSLWIDFYKAKTHAQIPSASVVPENDASVLFINSGMHPLVPYLMGESHPQGKRLCNIQKCIRTGDIEEVGNPNHLTFFEMMGNWSLGDYFKKEKIAWSWEFMTGKEWLNIDPNRLYVTCFEGDEVSPKDTESAEYWLNQGVGKDHIYFLPKSENWWQLPSGTGPCGPCTESFYDTGKDSCNDNCNPSCNCGRFVEIGNDVFMEYIIENVGEKPKLNKQRNVDTGFGLERNLCLVNGHKSVYETELFAPAIDKVKASADPGFYNEQAARIICEHTRAAVIMIADGIIPSNKGQGYVLRRLVRRAVLKRLEINCHLETIFDNLIDFFCGYLGEYYEQVATGVENIKFVFNQEKDKFFKTVNQGVKEFEKVIKFVHKDISQNSVFSGKTAFRLYETYGFPIELTKELCEEKGLSINMEEFTIAKQKHTLASQTANTGAFKGGLADTTGATTKLHTATHILHSVLRSIYGFDLHQKGSNITPERLRFDFNLDHKMTADELNVVEVRVNEIIAQDLDIIVEEMNVENARLKGAIGVFNSKYGDVVKIYSITSPQFSSVEFCGGPHVNKTSELGAFKIQKEESVSAGVRRIKAVLN